MDRRTRRLIAREKDPRVLHGLIESLSSEINRLRAVINEIEAEKARQAQTSLNIEEQLKVLRKMLFGRSKEDRLEASDRPRDKSQQEALIFSQAAFPAPESRQSNPLKSNIEEKITDHDISAEERVEESRLRGLKDPSPDQWEKLEGVYDQLVQIHVVERSYIKEIHRKCKYKLKAEFNPDPEKEVIITAKGPAGLLPGMNYSTAFVSQVVADKYISHLPLERQTRAMESLGLKGVKTSTLSRLCALAAASLEPIQEAILGELKRSDLALHLDETPWKIQNKNQKDGYMWIISNRYGSYYFFKPSRSGQMIKEKLKGYQGPVMSDGFSGYNALDEPADKIVQGYCWAHARRNFLALEGHDPTVKPILDDIDELFRIERQAGSFSELRNLRQGKSLAVLDRLKARLIEEYPSSREGSQKRKAIEYILKRWNGFTLFLEDTRMPLSNNEAERTIRHAVVGRKNYYGAATHAGADTAATLFSIIETCKKNDLDPRTYILMALQMVSQGENPPTPLEYARHLRQ